MAGNEIKISKEKVKEVAGYKTKVFPKYASPLLNMLNRWAGGTHSKIVGQMSDLVPQCPYRDYDKWKEWYLKKHPEAIENATKLIMEKIIEVKKQFDKIDEDVVRLWVEDLVIDKSFWGLKIQEAILKELQELTGKKTRLATAKEEQKGIDGFIGDIPVQVKPDSLESAPQTIKTEKYIERVIKYKKTDKGDYLVDISSVKDLIKK